MNNNQPRKFIIMSLSGFLLFTSLLIGVNLLAGWMQTTFFWGIPIGLVLGAIMCMYMSTQWDPATLSSKGANKSGNSRYIYISVIAGGFSLKLINAYVSQTVADMITGIIGSFMYVICLYMIIQVWRHR